VKGQITQDKACWKCALKKRLKQIYNNISFPAQASDFTLKIFSSMVSDKVYDIYILAHTSNRVFSKHSWKHANFCLNSLSRQILIKNNKKKSARIYCHLTTKKSTWFTFYQLYLSKLFQSCFVGGDLVGNESTLTGGEVTSHQVVYLPRWCPSIIHCTSSGCTKK